MCILNSIRKLDPATGSHRSRARSRAATPHPGQGNSGTGIGPGGGCRAASVSSSGGRHSEFPFHPRRVQPLLLRDATRTRRHKLWLVEIYTRTAPRKLSAIKPPGFASRTGLQQTHGRCGEFWPLATAVPPCYASPMSPVPGFATRRDFASRLIFPRSRSYEYDKSALDTGRSETSLIPLASGAATPWAPQLIFRRPQDPSRMACGLTSRLARHTPPAWGRAAEAVQSWIETAAAESAAALDRADPGWLGGAVRALGPVGPFHDAVDLRRAVSPPLHGGGARSYE